MMSQNCSTLHELSMTLETILIQGYSKNFSRVLCDSHMARSLCSSQLENLKDPML